MLVNTNISFHCASLQKVHADPPKRGRRSSALKVAMAFPSKKVGKKRPVSEPLPQIKVQDPDSEAEEENFMHKRALNIKENKEMVQLTDLSLSNNFGQNLL